MVGVHDARRAAAGGRRALRSDSGLLPPGVAEVGLIPDRDGWHAYCERAPGGGFIDSGTTRFLRADRGRVGAVTELAAWMRAHWQFDEARAIEAAWLLFEGADPRA